MGQKDQVAITLSPKEREIAERVAKELGRPLASVLRDCALDGLTSQVERIQKLRDFMAEQENNNV